MGTIQAKRFKEGLQKVRKVGRIEEPMTIAGCEVVIQNLSLEEYTSTLRECDGLDALEYTNVFQIEQVCHALIELDGQDLRDVDLIEDEVSVGHFTVEFSVPTKAAADAVVEELQKMKVRPVVAQVEAEGTKTLRFERHQWLRDNVVRHWGREAVAVAWRKVTEMFLQADAKAKEGIHFMVPDESPEDKLRRCLNELAEIESELPDDMLNKILAEMGLVRKSSQQELDTVNTRMQQVAAPQPAPQPVPVQAPPQAAAPAPVQHSGPPPVPFDPSSYTPPEAVQRAMAGRARMNQEGGSVPIPSPPPETVPVSAAPRAKIAEELRRQAIAATQQLQGAHGDASEGIVTRRGRSRAEEIAALEGMDMPSPSELPALPTRQAREVVPIQGESTDPSALAGITERPPLAGRNAKFNPRF